MKALSTTDGCFKLLEDGRLEIYHAKDNVAFTWPREEVIEIILWLIIHLIKPIQEIEKEETNAKLTNPS